MKKKTFFALQKKTHPAVARAEVDGAVFAAAGEDEAVRRELDAGGGGPRL